MDAVASGPAATTVACRCHAWAMRWATSTVMQVGAKGGQIFGPARQFADRAAIVAPQQMITADTNLQYALIKDADGVTFRIPGGFEHLMARKVMARVKEPHSIQQERVGGIGAAITVLRHRHGGEPS